MNNKVQIFNSLRSLNAELYPKPDLSAFVLEAVRYADPFAQFCSAVRGAGGDVVDLAGCTLDEMIKRLYPDAVRVASTIDGCTGFNPDEMDSPDKLDGTEAAVVKGEFGVAENGAVWLQQLFRHRVLLFISDALVVVIERNAIVNNMHETYSRLGEVPTGYGIFISDPSKTADIEQALVFGAHGARNLTILITDIDSHCF